MLPISVPDMNIAIVSDSRLAFTRFSNRVYVKPGRENNTPNHVDIRRTFEKKDLAVTQFSFSGLKAFDSYGTGNKDRRTFFNQLMSAYPRK